MYLFNGIFTKESVDLRVAEPDLIVKKIDSSLTGILFSQKQSSEDIYEIIDETELAYIVDTLGISEGLWLSYFCWGGALDFVAGIQFKDGLLLPETHLVGDSDQEEIFAELMRNYGIPLGENGYFPPFVRGYWNE